MESWNRLSREEEDELIELYRSGLSIRKVGIITGRDYNTVRNVLIRRGEPRRPQGRHILIPCDRDFFEEIDTEHKAYVLGFLAADGAIVESNFRLCVSAKDKKHVERIARTMGSEHKITDYVDPDGHLTTVWSVPSTKMVLDLTKHGVGPRKTHTQEFPTHLSSELVHHYVRGYFDGDGTVYPYLPKGYQTPQIRVALYGNYDFLRGCRQFFHERCHTNPDVQITPKAGSYMLFYGGNPQVQRIAEALYKDATIYLPRKRERFDPLIGPGALKD